MMKKLYPLKFIPQVQEKAWGSESWEISDIGGVTSVVSNGFLAENDITDILETYMGDMVGENVFDYHNIQFPLLFKYLNINDMLSVQVHPDDETAGEMYGCYGKTEAWYVIDAKPDAEVYMGFKRDTNAQEFYDACKAGTAAQLMNCYHPVKGDFFFIEAGTVHAAGKGLKIAEVQESSDITFRLYDWGRENDPATRREMHLEEALGCINFNKYDDERCHLHCGAGVQKLVESRFFTLTSIDLTEPRKIDSDDFESFVAYMCTCGSASFHVSGTDDSMQYNVAAGETIFVPAMVDDYVVAPEENGTHLIQVSIDYIDDTDGYFDEE